MLRKSRYLLLLFLTFSLCIFIFTISAQNDNDTNSEEPRYDDCQEIRRLMQSNLTPYDFDIGGGGRLFESAAEQEVEGVLGVEAFANYYIFRATGTGTLTISINNADAEFEIGVTRELLLLDEGFISTENAEEDEIEFEIVEPGLHTLVVRRPHVTDEENAGEYSLDLAFEGSTEPVGNVSSYEEGSGSIADVVLLSDSRQQVRFNTGSTAYIPAESAYGVTDNSTLNWIVFGEQSGIRFDLASDRINDFVQNGTTITHLTGGSIGANWQGGQGPLVLYIESIDYEANPQDLLKSGTAGDFFDTDYGSLSSVYILDGCVGFRLSSIGGVSNTFIAPIDPDAEEAVNFTVYDPPRDNVTGDRRNPGCEDFFISLNAPDTGGETVLYEYCITFDGIEPGTEILLEDGLLRASLIGERHITLQSQVITSFFRSNRRTVRSAYNSQVEEDPRYVHGDYHQLYDVYVPSNRLGRLAEQGREGAVNTALNVGFQDAAGNPVDLIIDWVNIEAFHYGELDTYSDPDGNDELELDERLCSDNTATGDSFDSAADSDDDEESDDPAVRCLIFKFSESDQIRDTLVRRGNDLLTVHALNDVIHVVYQGEEGDEENGEELLILPASETYIEIVTPAGDVPEVDYQSLPGEEGFIPRHVNNLGGECYPYPDIHPEANCAPNGQPNPANGNLWYGVVDHQAAGYLIDLALTRSYNSGDAATDGPFGYGWSTDFMLDYNVGFDEARNARTITPDVTANYRVGLDLTYAPRGYIVYTTATGSQHIFEGQLSNNGENDSYFYFYRSLTMPGWALFRPNIRDDWQLYKPNGERILFDRAGRMYEYGFYDQSRTIDIVYTSNLEDRLDGTGGLGETNRISISDDFNQRSLELYYNSDHHIIRSVLRDRVLRPDFRLACELGDNCYETLYRYDNLMRLEQVIYPNRQSAIYEYDTNNLLVCHTDPRAPIAPNMRYEYDAIDEQGQTVAYVATDLYVLALDETCDSDIDEDARSWLSLDYNFGTDQFTTEVTDYTGYTLEYGYAIVIGEDATWNDRTARYEIRGITREDVDGTVTGSTFEWGRIAVSRPSPFNLPTLDALDYRLIRFVRTPETGRSTEYVYNNNLGGRLDEIVLQQINDSGTANEQVNRYLAADFYESRFSYPLDTILYLPPLEISLGGRQLATNNRPFLDTNYSSSLGYTSTGSRDSYLLNSVRRGNESYSIRYYQEGWVQQIDHSDGGYFVRTQFSYNSVGLITRRDQLTTEGIYTIAYVYDGLGRMAFIFDEVLGLYEITNEVLNCEDGDVCREIMVTDPVGGVTIYRYDGRENLIEVRFQEGTSGNLLRRSCFAYDEFGRLTEEAQYVNDIGGECNFDRDNSESPDVLVTDYSYDLADDDDSTEIIITRTDPAGRTAQYVYDARQRLIASNDEFGHQDFYSYDDASSTLTQLACYNNTVEFAGRECPSDRALTFEYEFDDLQRLTNFNYQPDATFDLDWEFDYSLGTHRPNSLQLFDGIFTTIDWGWDERDQQVTTMGISNARFGDANTASVRLFPSAENDLIRYTVVDATSSTVQITRCDEETGGYRLIYHRQGGGGIGFAPCDLVSENIDAIYTYDVHDRLLEVVDEFGTRSFTYLPDNIQDFRWRVTMTATSGDQTYTWNMIYNLAGDLLQWTDDHGVTRSYEYDLIGRLVSISTGDENDTGTINFSYNALNQVTEVRDSLGNGTRYRYDDYGRLITQEGINRAGNIEYTYNEETGLLETYSNAVTNTNISYGYDNSETPFNPTLITGLTYSGENEDESIVHEYAWEYDNINNNILRYTNPNGNQLEYNFNGLGLLASAEDAEGNDYAWGYNGYGYLSFYSPPDIHDIPFNGTVTDISGTVDRDFEVSYSPIYESNNAVRMSVTSGSTSNPNRRVNWRFFFEREPIGLAESFTDAGLLQFDYDPLARLNHVVAGFQSGELAYEWSIAYRDGSDSLIIDAGNGRQYTVFFNSLDQIRSVDGNQRVDYRYFTPLDGQQRIEVTVDGELVEHYNFGDESGDNIVYQTFNEERTYSLNQAGDVTQLVLNRCEGETSPGCDGADTIFTTTYDFDTAGNIIRIEYPDNTVDTFEYQYDAIGNLTRYTLNSDELVVVYSYNEADLIDNITMTQINDDGETEEITLYYGYVGDQIAAVSYNQPFDDTPSCTDEYVIVCYGYDALGNIARQQFIRYTIPSDRVFDNALEEIVGTVGYSGTNFTYNPSGELARSGTSAEITYSNDGLGLPDSYNIGFSLSDDDSSVDYRLAYDFDYAQNIGFDLANPIQLHVITPCAINTGSDSQACANPIALNYANYSYTYDSSGRVAEFVVGEDDTGHSFVYDYGIDGITVSEEEQGLSVLIPYEGITPVIAEANDTTVITGEDGGLVISETRFASNDDNNQVHVQYHYRRDENLDLRDGLPLIAQTITIGDAQQPADGEELEGVTNINTNAVVVDNVHRYYYNYDVSGNLIEVIYVGPLATDRNAALNLDPTEQVKLKPLTCAIYNYDGANRLIEVRLADNVEEYLEDMTDNTVPQSYQSYFYAYDAYNRLIQAGDYAFVYIDDAEIPSFVYDGAGNGTAIGQTGFDGRFDARGRLIDPDASPETGDPCRIGLSVERPDFEAGEVLYNGMIVDPRTELAFINGRAYMPAIGRFLQRNTEELSPSVSIYDYHPNAVSIPMPDNNTHIGDGLYVLYDAMMRHPDRQLLTSDDILEQYLPSIDLQYDSLTEIINGHTQASDALLQNYLNLPVWLLDTYNQPDATYDFTSGTLLWDRNIIAGQYTGSGNRQIDFDTPFWERSFALNSPIIGTQTLVSGALDSIQVDFRPPTNPTGTWYERQSQFISSDMLPAPVIGVSPDRIGDWLLPVWTEPERNVEVLDLTTAITTQYQQTGMDWLRELLSVGLPDEPGLPLPEIPYAPGLETDNP
mgnify:CR=1 FL=1